MSMVMLLPHKVRLALSGLSALGFVAMVPVGAAQAQNLDQGKSGARLFADSCATCHRSPRHLAKGRLRMMLFAFLQQHYATSSNSASELTSYLESVDTPATPAARTATTKRHGRSASTSSPRPPAPIPQR